ncbi:MAG: regulatory protein RecX [Solirubrobacterales bacterium]
MSDEPLSLALKALDRKERTVAEMGSWLRARGVGTDEADEVLDRLISTGVLDDARYARRYTEDKRELRGWGSERIRTALRDRGVPDADVEEVLGDVDSDQEIERAVELLRSRGETLADALERQRALGALIRRGYDSEIAYEAIRRARRE